MASGDSSDVDFDIDWSILADSMDPHFLDLSHLKLDSVYAGVFGSRKSLISVTGRAGILTIIQNGKRHHGGNARRLRVVTL